MPSVSENILFLISGLGILQGILLASLIYFHPKSDRAVNTFLALHIFFISVVMAMPFMIRFITWQRGNFIQPLLLLPPIFLYFYLKSFKERITFKKALPHFLMLLLFFTAVYWNTSSIVAKYPNVKVPPKEIFYDPFNMTIPIVNHVIKIFYYFLARQKITSYQKSIQQLFSETSRINLSWAKVLVNGYLFLVIAGIIIFSLMLRYPEHFNSLLLINVAIATPYIYFATYKGIKQPTIWQLLPGTNKETVEQEMHETEEIGNHVSDYEKIKLSKSGIGNDKIDDIVKKITILMEQEKLYQEAELTLQQLAGRLYVPTYQVSQSLNEGMKKNFYEVVNGYRVEEAKRLLLDEKNRNFTILSVGFEAGFNSKTTFNTVFKKFTGLTPTEFRDKEKRVLLPA